MTDNIAISVDDLRKKYKRGIIRRQVVDALQGVSFDVKQGEIFGLLGPNGAGKTTLIKILLGIVQRTGGQAQVLGLAVGDRRGRQSKLRNRAEISYRKFVVPPLGGMGSCPAKTV